MNLACSKFGNRALSTFSIRWNDPKLPFVPKPSNGSYQPFYDIRAGCSLRGRLENEGRIPGFLCKREPTMP